MLNRDLILTVEEKNRDVRGDRGPEAHGDRS
jgi:hypothetical protein